MFHCEIDVVANSLVVRPETLRTLEPTVSPVPLKSLIVSPEMIIELAVKVVIVELGVLNSVEEARPYIFEFPFSVRPPKVGVAAK